MDLSTAIYSFIALGEHVSGYAPMFIFVGVLIAAYILHQSERLKAAA